MAGKPDPRRLARRRKKSKPGDAKAKRPPAERVDRAVGKLAPALAELIGELPFPPVAQTMAAQASEPELPALQTLMQVARDALGTPAAVWDERERIGLAVAQTDDGLHRALQDRLEQRWDAARTVVRQLRGTGAIDETIADDAATLHLLAVGLGMSMLGDVLSERIDPNAWVRLSTRLLDSLAVVDPALDAHVEHPQLWRARVSVPANPTAFAQILRTVALLGVSVNQVFSSAGKDDRQQVDMVLVAPRTLDRSTLLQALDAVATDVILVRGLPDDTDDLAARVLRLASSVARHPDAAPQAAAELAFADSWEIVPASEGPDAGPLVLRIQWTVEQHVVLRRVVAPFTHTEYLRAAALLELVASLSAARGATEAFGWSSTLADGTRIWVRLARPDDADAVERLHARASRDSVYQRYFTPMNTWREENLRRISGGHRGATLVAVDKVGDVIALGNIFPAGPEAAESAEIAVLVDDAWHRRGIGRIVISRLIEIAPRLGFSEVIAYVLAENHGMIALLESLPVSIVPDGWKRDAAHDLGASVVKLTTQL